MHKGSMEAVKCAITAVKSQGETLAQRSTKSGVFSSMVTNQPEQAWLESAVCAAGWLLVGHKPAAWWRSASLKCKELRSYTTASLKLSKNKEPQVEEGRVLQKSLHNPTKKPPKIKKKIQTQTTRKVGATEVPEMVVAVADHLGSE